MTSDVGPQQQPDDGPWLELWLSAPRLERYLAASDGDRERALRLYDWNARISAALLCDLAHFEVALRNAPTTVRSWRAPTPSAGLKPTGLLPRWRSFHPLSNQAHSGRCNAQHTDINRKPTRASRRGRAPPPEAPLGVSRQGHRESAPSASGGICRRRLTRRACGCRIFYPAFPPKTNRSEVDARVGRLHNLRNRVAHHEPLLSTNVMDGLDDLLWVAERLDPSIAQYISVSSDVRTRTAPERAEQPTRKTQAPVSQGLSQDGP